MGTIRDVTQETYLRQLLHDTNRIAHVGGWEVDMEQGKVTWTSETYRMHELDENQQVSLQQAIDFYHEEDRPALSEALERMTSRGEPFDLELRIISALGNKKWVRASGRGIEQRDGKIIRIRGAVQDITERKEKEEAVIKYSERLLLAAQTARIGIWELDLESGHLSWNEEQHKIYGITPAEFAADMDHWKTLVHPEDREETKAALDKARQGQEVFDVAYRIIRHDREIRYLDASARPIRDSQGRIVKLIGVNLDVTKIRQSEAAIRRYSERLTLATESAGIGIWDLNVLTSRLHWDVRTLELYGIQPEAFKGTFEEWKAAVHPDDFEAAYQSLERALETGQDYEAEFRVIRRDSGQISYMKACARVITDSNGKPLRMVGVGWDITQSKEYEKSLQTYAERMRLASASASFSVWEVNLLTNEITWNDKAYDIYGVDPDTFKINVDNWKQLLHPEDLEGALRHYQDAASGREELNNHFRVIHPGSGETRYIRSTGTLVKDEQGKVVRFIGIDMDITELKENEAQLLKKNEELTKANSELDHFVYSTSHNLRAPLTSIMGIVDVMRKLNDPEELQKFMNLIEKSIFKLDETIQEISAYSKNSRLEIQSEPIELPALIEEVADSLSFMENADRISFETDIPEKLSFHSDTGRLKIIFNNLLSNSVKYCDPRQESPYVKVSVEPQESGIKIIFSDNGIGISQQYTDRIFNMFFRATNKASGSGLGLYIVKEAVEKLGGSISIDSELSVGTTFIILLPDLP
jgi:PAS domain S-box-containing protein